MTPIKLVDDFIKEQYSTSALLAHEKTALEKLRYGVEYAYAVTEGKKVAGKLTIDACKRFLGDFARSDFGEEIWFDFDSAFHVLKFYALCICHVKGKWAGKPIDLMDWHAFILINIFGWYKPQYKEDEETGDLILDDDGNRIPVIGEDGEHSWVRRFNTIYIEVARKNAKSTLSSGIGLYMTAFDGEGGAEVYSAATTKDQARIVFDDAKNMIKKSRVLKKLLGVHKLNIHHIDSASKFEPLSSDANSLDGLNVHCGIVDEVHAHKTRDVWDVLETATGAREQPLLVAITTAGTNLEGICIELRDYCVKLLTKVIDDDSFFGIIYTLDDDDDPFDESCWYKANPGLGICKKWTDMRRLAKKAQAQISAKPNFFTKHLNRWVRGGNPWMDMDKFSACPSISEGINLPTWVGIDLAQKVDICAAVKVKKKPSNTVSVECKFWIPEDRLLKCSQQMAQLYQKWIDAGHLTAMDGAVIDYQLIKDELIEWVRDDNLQQFAYDPWSATQFALSLVKSEKPVVEVTQNVKNMSEAMKTTEARVLSGDFEHDHNPVMIWMMSNVQVKVDLNENIFPLKASEENKIDGPVALFNAMSRVIHGEEDGALDWYDDDEILFI